MAATRRINKNEKTFFIFILPSLDVLKRRYDEPIVIDGLRQP